MSKLTGCFIKLLSELYNILKTNGDHKDKKLEVIQTILGDIKIPGLANQKFTINKEKIVIISC